MSLVYLAVIKMVLRGATAEIRVGCRPWSRATRALFAWLDPRWAAIEQLLAAGERLVEVR